MDWTLEDSAKLWLLLNSKDGRIRRQGTVLARTDPGLRRRLLEAVFGAGAPFITEVPTADITAETLSRFLAGDMLWQTGLAQVQSEPLQGLYCAASGRRQRWLHLHEGGVLVAASVGTEEDSSIAETADQVSRWLHIDKPDYFQDHASSGVWCRQGQGVRLFSACSHATVLSQGRVDGTRLRLSSLSLANGHLTPVEVYTHVARRGNGTTWA